MKKSITEVYQNFYRTNLRNLFLLNFTIIGTLVSFLIFNAFDKSLNNAHNIIETNKNYITGLVLAGGDDTIREFLENENRKSDVHFFRFVSSHEKSNFSTTHSENLFLGNEKLGTLYYGIHPLKVIPWLTIMMLMVLSVLFTFFMKMAFDRASEFLRENIVHPLKNLSSSIHGSNTVLDLSQTNGRTQEIMEISLIQDAFIEFTGKLVESEVAIAKTKVAQQVAHDIRSPLSALEMISSNLVGIEEDKRLIIRNSINRIRDIANTLSKDNRLKSDDKLSVEQETTLLSSVIEMMVTEKRYEIVRKSNIQILFDQSVDSYGLFAKTVLPEFKRILSNLLNNSIEAIGDKQGVIEIKMHSEDNRVYITVQDNGCGMNELQLKNVIQNRISSKRKSGTGLGLSHAMDSVLSWGGKLNIDSESDLGTTVKIILKQQAAPEWFVDVINLEKTKDVVVFDDDETIHQMWASKLESTKSLNHHLNIRHFKDRITLEKFYGKNFADLDDAIYLMDFEIHNQETTGLDLIEFLGIQKQSILVTSHYEDENIRRRCLDIGVRMIPKNMAGFVKMNV